jgi:hypothetical protein
MKSRKNVGPAALLVVASLVALRTPASADEPEVLVYGATPGGIAAALAAGADGRSVLLVEPTRRIGGLVTSGLSHTDIRTLEGITGAFADFSRRVEDYYRDMYGADSPEVAACYHGIFGEPKVNLLVFEKMIAEDTNIRLVLETRFGRVDVRRADDKLTGRIRSVELIDSEGMPTLVRPAMVIDATYEGDLMAAAGVDWRVGREGRDELNESLAPEKADGQLQAYNYRFIMTREPDNRVTPTAPEGYRREDFLPVLEVLRGGKIESVFGYPSKCQFKAHLPVLPNEKYDINDVSHGEIRLSLPGQNLGWPDGSPEERRVIASEHLRDQAGLVYFLQNDPDVPENFREETRQWGWCRDEFVDSNHLPPQLYVREARRMRGRYVFTQWDVEAAENRDPRAVSHWDSIAIGDYGPNCHGTAHEGPRFGGKHVGEFYQAVAPYQIPYGILLPNGLDNLLVCGAVSSSHVGFCALRLEPIWMSLGQASGHAAHLAIEGGATFVVSPSDVQRRLHERGAATIYVSDVGSRDPDFAMVQWWGQRGGWHGLAERAGKYGQRGENLQGQYFAAFPQHAADLDKPLDKPTVAHWEIVTLNSGVVLPKSAARAKTRREWLKSVWDHAQKRP